LTNRISRRKALDDTDKYISHHMAVLVRAGLVVSEKRGRWMYYRRNEAALARLATAVRRAV